MKVRVLKDTVIDGSVRWAGEEVEVDRPTSDRFERELLVERAREEDYEDKMEDRYGRAHRNAPLRDIMVFTPVYRLESETVEAVLNLEWPGPITWVFQRDNPNEIVGDLNKSGDARRAGIWNHLHQYQRGRETFLAGKYDAMLVIESDIIPPRDALKKLAAVQADVVYGVYRFRVNDVINIFELYPDKEGKRPRNIGESLSLHPHLLRRAVKLGVYPCSGAGLGCILIKRKVLEAIDFRLEDKNGGHCDTLFSGDAMQAGFRQAAEMSVICGHKHEPPYEGGDGEVLWPRL